MSKHGPVCISNRSCMRLIKTPAKSLPFLTYMAPNTWISCSLASFLSFITFTSMIHLNFTSATDTISPGQSLSGNQTIVSNGGTFVLGFFSPGNSTNSYIGIWYGKVSKQTVIWVANRETPIPNTSSSELKVTSHGNLILLDSHSKTQVWSSKPYTSPPPPSSIVAVLLDTGNLVLRDKLNSSAILWQSFDYPTDTWVPESWIGMNKVTGEYQTLTSWKNSEDPAPGLFSDTIDPNGTSEFFQQWNKSVTYIRSGVWDEKGQSFAGTPITPGMRKTTLINLSFVDNDQRRHITCSLYHKEVITRTVMDVGGQIRSWVWVQSAQVWLLLWSRPFSQCDVYSICGPFGVCDQKSQSSCSCSSGFAPASPDDWVPGDWSSGCKRITNLNCGGNGRDRDGFLMMPNMQAPNNSVKLGVSDGNGCSAICLSNCSCTAYSYDDRTGCSVWYGELRNLQQLHDGDAGSGLLYLRVSAADLPNSNKRIHGTTIGIAAACGALGIILVVAVLVWGYRRRKMYVGSKRMDGSLIRFNYSELQRMTNKFSERLGGGSFGSVFKGVMPDSTAIAVKKLEGLSQGEKQFRMEVSTLGLIQHSNLIRLRGFCSEGSKRMLVYDYMPNGSLDHHLFGKNSNGLDWKSRYQIILGIARGLYYLHEKCRECIIHCDIKPENILLDCNFCPKVADFGMAKLVGRELSRVLTTMRGTIGYLAPEWISGLPITPKADVYSFGMMLFELISGRRNTQCSKDGKMDFFPIVVVSRLITEGEMLSLLDEKLDGNTDMEEVRRVCKLACWCIQDAELDRPTMGKAVQVLERTSELNMPPVPRSLQHLGDQENMMSSSDTSYFSKFSSSDNFSNSGG